MQGWRLCYLSLYSLFRRYQRSGYFLYACDYPQILNFAKNGLVNELTDVRCLAKVFKGEFFMDVILNSVINIGTVDETWYAYTNLRPFTLSWVHRV